MPGTYMPLSYIPSPCSLIEKGPGKNEGKVVGLVCAGWLLTALPLGQVTPSGKKSPLALHNSSKNDLLNHPP